MTTAAFTTRRPPPRLADRIIAAANSNPIGNYDDDGGGGDDTVGLEALELVRLVDNLSMLTVDQRFPRLDRLLYGAFCALARSVVDTRGGQTGLVRDFFLMDTPRFVDRHLDALSDHCSVEQRQRIFRLKCFLSSTLHTNRDLSAGNACRRRPGRSSATAATPLDDDDGDDPMTVDGDDCDVEGSGDGTTARDTMDPDLLYALAARARSLEGQRDLRTTQIVESSVVDVCRGDGTTRRRVRVCEFTPTFAVYTVCSLRKRFQPQALGARHRARFDDNLESLLADEAQRERAAAGGSASFAAKRRRRDFGCGTNEPLITVAAAAASVDPLGLAGQLPTRDAWYALCNNAQPPIASIGLQVWVNNARSMVHRDKLLTAILNLVVRADGCGDDGGDVGRRSAAATRRRDVTSSSVRGNGGGGDGSDEPTARSSSNHRRREQHYRWAATSADAWDGRGRGDGGDGPSTLSSLAALVPSSSVRLFDSPSQYESDVRSFLNAVGDIRPGLVVLDDDNDDDHDDVEKEELGYRIRAPRFDRNNANVGFELFVNLLDGMTVAWSKLSFIAPQVFVP